MIAIDVSLVLNVHNETSYLRRTLRSLEEAARYAAAAGLVVELVIVQDRSPEDTRSWLAAYRSSNAFTDIRSLEVDNGSAGLSRNDGARYASGTHVIFYNAGDLISFNSLLSMVSTAERAEIKTLVFTEYALELTSRCNLRCIYCNQSTGAVISHDLPLEATNAIIDALIELGVNQVSLTGRGENTLATGWQGYVERLLESGVKVSIITNLARPITDGEARTFARMSDVCLSIDTVDRATFKHLRTGDLRIALENVTKIMAANQKLRHPEFRMRWSAVVTVASAPGLIDLAATAVAMGVSRVEFHCLIGTDSVERRPATLDEMDPATRRAVCADVQAAERFLIDHLGPDAVFVAPGLRSVVASQ